MNENPTCPHNAGKIFAVIILGLAIALGNIIGGWFIADGLYRIKNGDRYVSVKGLAEKQVKANLALWNISYKAAGDDLQQLSAKAAADKKIVTDFLIANGFAANEFEQQPTTVIDQYANEYSSGNKPEQRYIINNAIKVRTDKVDLVQKVSGFSSELISQGVLLNKDYTPNPRYVFTQLDSIRPAMLEEATKSALLVAEQFAKNSNSHIGAIKRANQGVFQILPLDNNIGNAQPGYNNDADQEGSPNKIIRVVSSIDYFLTEK